MARLPLVLPAFVCRHMKFMMAPVELPSPRSDSPEALLSDWMLIARRNKALHKAARAQYARMSDVRLITAVVLDSAGGLINILLGAVSAEYGVGAAHNISQVALGAISVISAAIISAAKQLQWEAKALLHGETAMHYAELARMINSERTLARIYDSGFASIGDLIKKVLAELDRFEESALAVPGFIEAKLGAAPLPRHSDV